MIPKENTRIETKLMKIYGKDMTVRRGKKHKYLGMDLDWRKKGLLGIGMIPYNKETVSMWSEPLETQVKTPAGKHLLKVNLDCKKLDKNREKLFQTLTARHLFSSKRSRGGIMKAAAFCTTRVKDPDEDDYRYYLAYVFRCIILD